MGDAVVNLSASIASVPTPSYVFSVNGQAIETDSLSAGDLSGNNIKLLTVKVKNNSPKSGPVSNLTVSNNRYRILQNTCNNLSLKPNQSCLAKMAVQGDNTNSELATQVAFDNKSSQVKITQMEQNLTGQMIAINDSVTLGDFYQEGTNKIQLLKIINQGEGTGNINSSSIELPPGDAIGSNNCSNVKPGSSCIVRLVYSSIAQDKGSHTDTVTIGDADVDLIVNQVTNPNDLQSLNLTVAADIAVGSCQPVSIALKDSENLDYVSSQSNTIISSISLYSDINCSNLDNLILAPFESSKNLFVKKDTSGNFDLSVTIKNKTEHKNIFFYSPLSLVSNKANIVVGQTAQLSISGGKEPYVLTTISGGGTLNSTGLYSSDTVGTANFKVTDALSQQAIVSINIVSLLTVNALSFEKVGNQPQTVLASGGLAPYFYSLVSGPGSIDSATGIYSSALSGSVVLKAKDSLNQEMLINGQIYAPLSVTPLSKIIVSTSSHQIAPAGGKNPYTYTKISGLGSVTSGGLFSSNIATTSEIKVADALGQEQTVSIQVVLPLAANISTFEKVINQTQSIQGQNGLPPYVYSKVSGVGSIDSSTGLYSAGAIAGAVQLKITDALNQSVLVSGQVFSQMNVNPLLTFIVSTDTYQIIPSGGKTPYSYLKMSGDGTISAGGLFSSATETTTNIKVSDSLGQEQIVTIQVVLPLAANISTFEKVVNQTQSIQGQKGLTPYVYSKVSGVGSIDSSTGLYSAGATAGVVQLKITDALNQSVLINGQVYSQLILSPLTANLIIPQTQSFSASGGKTPYTFSKISGVGNINTSGLFDSALSGTAQIKVTDALNQSVTASIQVYDPLQIVAQKTNQIVSTNQTFSATGGATPYVYSVVSGGGTINSSSGLFTAPSTASTVKIKVTDASNQSSEINIQVVPVLTINPTTASVITAATQTFSGVGGLTPYVYSIVSGNGTINSSSGLFTAPGTVGTTVVKVTDALNQTAQATVTVFSNIAITAGNCSFSVPESMTCTVSSSGGIGSRTYTTDVGTINSTTGVFKGTCVNNNGSSIITVSDQNNNTAQITLSYPCVYKSCNQIKADIAGSISGVYWIDLDGLNTGSDPFQIYCNQDLEQGGWALVTNAGTTNAAVSTLTSSSFSNGNPNYSNNFNLYQLFPNFNTTNKLVMINGTTRVPGIFIPDSVNSRWSSNTVGDTSPAYNPFIQFITASNYIYGWGFSQTQIGQPNVGRSSWCSNDGLYLYLNADGTHTGVSSWQAGCNSNAYWKNNFTWQMYDKIPYFKYPISCADAKAKGSNSSGTYTIDPDGANSGLEPYAVYCDMVARTESTIVASGGTINDYTVNGVSYRSHTFPTGTTNLSISQVTSTTSVDVLIVAGGGGGGSSKFALGGGGGGGAGGVVYSSAYNLNGQTSSVITIGDGGNPGTTGGGTNGSNGFSSSAFGLTASGGGGGGHGATCGAGQTGASGGGAGYCGYGANNSNGGATQGNVGGRVVASPSNSAGGAGGGGAGGAGGSNFATHNGGIGGSGLSYSISGSSVTYGIGGNGAGSNSAQPGAANTGNGGYGAYADSSSTGKGGSGIVIIKYQYKLP